mmetsp:Transcript_46240/g.74086  ORF Transcript_46240/g.74086 Transcript_46240/m.74086 type:complete len:207 (-) Transcript_46240:303-923(-)
MFLLEIEERISFRAPEESKPGGMLKLGVEAAARPGAGGISTPPVSSPSAMKALTWRLGEVTEKGSWPSTPPLTPDLDSNFTMLLVAAALLSALSLAEGDGVDADEAAPRSRRRPAATPAVSSIVASRIEPALSSSPCAATSPNPESPEASASANTELCALAALSPPDSASVPNVLAAVTAANWSSSSLETLTLLTASSSASMMVCS